MTTTIYPYRRVLSLVLRHLALSICAPAINDVLSSKVHTTFGDANVVGGEKMDVGEPTICVVAVQGYDEEIASDSYYATFLTNFIVKTPTAGDNAPEDFDLFFNTIEDVFRDVFNSSKRRVITPVNPNTSANPLKDNQSFYDCKIGRFVRMPQPVQGVNGGVTRTPGMVISHTASLNYSPNRAQTLG